MIYWLGTEPDSPFPPHSMALEEPNGLLAAGGDLHPQRLIKAYHQGVFPWYSDEQPILWWSPDPRCVLPVQRVHISRRFRRQLNQSRVTISVDRAFNEVLNACADIPRKEEHGTWIVPAMKAAYLRLFELGYAHSVEVWDDDELVGGLYGVLVGRMFFAESMFTVREAGSKIALIALCRLMHRGGAQMIDCQLSNPHLFRMGACEIPRAQFLKAVEWHSHKALATPLPSSLIKPVQLLDSNDLSAW